jgi:hypothetical protein
MICALVLNIELHVLQHTTALLHGLIVPCPDRKVDIKDNQLGIKLIPMISTWDQADPIFPVRAADKYKEETRTFIEL